MGDMDTLIERWRANCRLAGVKLTDEDIERARQNGALDVILRREALIQSLNAWAELPDYLDLRALERDA